MQKKLWVSKYEAHETPEENLISQALISLARSSCDFENCFRCKTYGNFQTVQCYWGPLCLGLQTTRLCFTSMNHFVSAHHLCALDFNLQGFALPLLVIFRTWCACLRWVLIHLSKEKRFSKYTDEKHLSVSINLPPSLWYLFIYIIFRSWSLNQVPKYLMDFPILSKKR